MNKACGRWLRLQFSSRVLLLVTLLVAVALAAYLREAGRFKIDSSSESVWLCGEAIDGNWEETDWRETTGVRLPGSLYNTYNFEGQSQYPYLIQQPLLTIAYKNYLGKEIYRVNVDLTGVRTEDWSEYWMQLMKSGNWNRDGGTSMTCQHTPGSTTLRLVVVQYFNTERRAKRLSVWFERVGDKFILKNDSADKAEE